MSNIKWLSYEYLAIHEYRKKELDNYGEPNYAYFHAINFDRVCCLSGNFSQEFGGFKSINIHDCIKEIDTMTFSNEQKKQIANLRKDPLFKKIMGEKALENKDNLETILGTSFTNQGQIIADENGTHYAYKTEESINREFDKYNEQINFMISSGMIKDWQAEKYFRDLDYISNYYLSQTNGEQIPLRAISDDEMQTYEDLAYFNKSSVEEEIAAKNEDLLIELQERQEIAARMDNAVQQVESTAQQVENADYTS